MTFSRKTSGVQTAITAPKRRASGAFVAIQNGYRRVSGAWVAIYTAVTVAITNQSAFSSGATGTRLAGYQLLSTGEVQKAQGLSTAPAYATVETWLLSGAASAYDVRATKASGNASVSGTLATWLNLGTSRAWTVSDGLADAVEQVAVLTVEIRNASTLAVLATASITLEADRG